MQFMAILTMPLSGRVVVAYHPNMELVGWSAAHFAKLKNYAPLRNGLIIQENCAFLRVSRVWSKAEFCQAVAASRHDLYVRIATSRFMAEMRGLFMRQPDRRAIIVPVLQKIA